MGKSSGSKTSPTQSMTKPHIEKNKIRWREWSVVWKCTLMTDNGQCAQERSGEGIAD